MRHVAAADVSLRLPPAFRLQRRRGGLLRDAAAGWARPPQHGYVVLFGRRPLGASTDLRPQGARLVGMPTTCALPLFGHVARVGLATFVTGAERRADTSFVVVLDVPQNARWQLGAAALHVSRPGRDSLLAALATLRLRSATR